MAGSRSGHRAASGAGTDDAKERPRITLVSKTDCHLCVLARQVISRVADELGVAWEERKITDIPDPDPLWWEQVPVTLIDGEVHDYWRVSEERLRSALGLAVK